MNIPKLLRDESDVQEGDLAELLLDAAVELETCYGLMDGRFSELKKMARLRHEIRDLKAALDRANRFAAEAGELRDRLRDLEGES